MFLLDGFSTMRRIKACFAGTRIEAMSALGRFADIVSIATVEGSWVHGNCLERDIEPYLLSRSNREDSYRFLLEQEVDIVFSAGFPFILPGHVLASGPLYVNSHPSLLPAYKGNGAIKEAYANNEDYMGVTVHYMVKEMDAGSLIVQEKVWVRGLKLQEVYDLLFSLVEPIAVTRAIERVYEVLR